MEEKKTFEAEYNRASAARVLSHATGKDSDGSIRGFKLKKAVVHKFKAVVNMVFCDSSGREVIVWATPASDAQCHFKTKNLNLTIQYGGALAGRRADKFAIAMMESFIREFSIATITDLERAIIEQSGKSKRPDFSAMTDLNLFFDTWGDADRATQFFYYDAVWRYYFVCYSYRHEGSINVLDKSVYVTHGDAECPRNFYFNLPGLHKFFAFPWNAESGRTVNLSENHSAVYSTDLDDMDIIDGGMKKLNKLLRTIALNPDFKVVFVNATCLAVIIGDDVESAIRELKEKTGIAVILLNALNMSVFEHLKELIDFGENANRSINAPLTTINLLGFMRNRGLEEVKEILGELGLTVNKCFLPDIEFYGMKEYLNAGLQAVHPGKAYADMTEKVFAGLPMKTVRPVAPCGISATWSFLETLATESGTIEVFKQFKDRNAARIAERWSRIIEESGMFRIGIVVDSTFAELLSDTEITWGIPLVQVLEEMGFKLHVFLETDNEKKDVATAMGLFANPGIHSISVFSGADELETLLAQPDSAQAVYSDVYYDNRLSRNGKSGFSINVFELGFEGAFRTAEKIQSLCRLPFYRRYAEYLRSGGTAAYE